MDYFSKFLRTGTQPSPQTPIDRTVEFNKAWNSINVSCLYPALCCRSLIFSSYQNTLLHPDERQLAKGIKSTDVPDHLKSMVDSLVWESTRTEDGLVEP